MDSASHEDLWRRLRLLERTPAADRNDRLHAVVSVHRVFLNNHQELFRHLKCSEGEVSPETASEDDPVSSVLQEAARLFHNFLAASYTLRGCTDSLVEHSFRGGIEAQEYKAKAEAILDSSDLYGFIHALRGYCQHHTLPLVGATFQAIGDQPLRAKLVLGTGNLRDESDRWPSGARRFLRGLPERYPLGVLVRDYFILVRNFYRWFQEWSDRSFGPQVEALNQELQKLRQEFLDAGLADPLSDS